MADGVNTAMNAVQAAGADAITHRTRGHPQPLQLLGRDDAVLASRNPRNLSVAPPSVDFFRDIRNKSTTQPNSPPSSPVFVPATPLER